MSNPCFACLYRLPSVETSRSSASPAVSASNTLVAIAADFSPRYERHRDDLVSIDISGLERLLGPPRAVGEELRRDAFARGLRVHVAVAATRMAALVLARACPGLTIVERGEEAAALAPLRIDILEKIEDEGTERPPPSKRNSGRTPSAVSALSVFKQWGLKTLGELAAMPPAELSARLGQEGLLWRAIARGEDVRPLVPDVPEERFESSLELEWPIEGLEPLSFVLTRLLEPLSTRLERRDRGAAVLRVSLRLVMLPSTRSPTQDAERDRATTTAGTGEPVDPRAFHTRRLELPSPIRGVRTLRTLALLDLESHPPSAPVDRVTVAIDPTPGRVLQHTLFTRAHPSPDQIATLLARLGALMGQDRLGAPATVDSHRPGAFEMQPFKTEHSPARESLRVRARDSEGVPARGGGAPRDRPVQYYAERGACGSNERASASEASGGGTPRAFDNAATASARGGGAPRELRDVNLVSALRRCRQPVPARVALEADRPVRLTTDRRGFAGGSVMACAGPWRTSGNWWNDEEGEAESLRSRDSEAGAGVGVGPAATKNSILRRAQRREGVSEWGWGPTSSKWNRDEWDVALSDGGVYRVFRDRDTNGWFIDGIVD